MHPLDEWKMLCCVLLGIRSTQTTIFTLNSLIYFKVQIMHYDRLLNCIHHYNDKYYRL